MALDNYNICLNIRKKNALNQGYVDVLINSAICLRQIGKIKQAIERTATAIQIYRDLSKNDENNIDNYYLLLAKLHLENADLHEAYVNYLTVYKMRQRFETNHPKRAEI